MDYIMTFKKNANKKWQLQRKFRRVVVESIYQSVRRRCLDLKEYSQKLAPVEKLILLNYFRQMLKEMVLMQEYKEEMEQLRTQVEEVYADDEEMIEFIEKRNKRTAKEKAREKALAKIREAESEEKTKK